jgi:hypothetical protein
MYDRKIAIHTGVFMRNWTFHTCIIARQVEKTADSELYKV